MKKLLMLLSSLALVASLTACGSKEETKGSQKEEMKYSEYLNEDNPKVEINLKDFGTIELELFPSVAPNTVANFLSLARDGFYDGLTMHRIINCVTNHRRHYAVQSLLVSIDNGHSFLIGNMIVIHFGHGYSSTLYAYNGIA